MIGEVGTVSVASHLNLAAALTAAGQRVDALVTDCPYSARTHTAYREQEDLRRHTIGYGAWSSDDVEAFVDAWVPLVTGWIVSITDHVLAPTWCAELEAAGLYTFSPIACVEPGRSARMSGDGPGQWSCWAVVARPRTAAAKAWGTLPGAYVVPLGYGRSKVSAPGVVGGKPIWLMRALVRDYSRPGDLVCDPCAGAGTTLVAAKMSGRRWIGGDCDAAHVEIARRRLEETVPCDARGTPIGGAKGKSEAFNWGDE